MKQTVKRVVLAYSGGLDTSIIVPWLKERYGCEVLCYCSDVGQGAELDGLEARAKASGADGVVVEDLRVPFARDFVFPALRSGAVYEGRYLLGTSLARPLIASRQVWAAERFGADAVAHGCTGKGNDQVRFELAYMALAPHLAVLAPWRDPQWTIRSREDALAYAEARGIAVPVRKGDLYSRDANLWHLSHEGGPLEDPAHPAPDDLYKLTANAASQPAWPETVTVGFDGGRPVRLNGVTMGPVELVESLNALAGRHGVGRVDIVESRLVGMKSRGVYETPAGTVLHEALEDLCRLVLPHDLYRTRQELSLRMADLIYNGQWFSPLRRALQSFADTALQSATGEVSVELHHGRATAVARTSAQSLYRAGLASFDMTGYDRSHAEGFIRLFGLPLAVAAQRGNEKPAPNGTVANGTFVAVGTNGPNGNAASPKGTVADAAAPGSERGHAKGVAPGTPFRGRAEAGAARMAEPAEQERGAAGTAEPSAPRDGAPGAASGAEPSAPRDGAPGATPAADPSAPRERAPGAAPGSKHDARHEVTGVDA